MRRMAASSRSLYATLLAGGRRSGRVGEELPGPQRGRETFTDVSLDLAGSRKASKRGNDRIRPEAGSLGVKTGGMRVSWRAAYVARHKCLAKRAAETSLFSTTHTLFFAI